MEEISGDVINVLELGGPQLSALLNDKNRRLTATCIFTHQITRFRAFLCMVSKLVEFFIVFILLYGTLVHWFSWGHLWDISLDVEDTLLYDVQATILEQESSA